MSKDLSPQQEMEEGADDVVLHVLQIPEILSKILSFMDFDGLNKTRLVNHLWKAESEIYFKQKAQINLFNSEEYDKVGVQRFLEICKSHQNFKLSLHVLYNDYVFPRKYATKKILNFVRWRLRPPPLIKCIRLELYVIDSQDFIPKLNILRSLTHLKELELKMYFLTCLEELDIDKAFQTVPKLPFVIKLDILLHFEEIDETMQKLCRKFVLMTPNLEELVPHVTCDDKDIDYMFLEEIVQLQKEWKDSKPQIGPMPFPNLSFIYGLRLNTLEASEKVMQSCLKFMQPLKGLGMIKLMEEDTFTLEKILQKNSTTLETLEISDCLGAVNIVPPVLQSLGRLSLTDGDVFNIRELFLMGSDKFKSTFPKLHSLVLENPENFLPLPNCRDLSFLQFKTLEVTCRGGKILDWDSDEDYGSGSGKEWAEWISKLFPNVHNPWINKARQNIQAMI